MSFSISCPFCDGTGEIGGEPCVACESDGVVSDVHSFIAVVVKYLNETRFSILFGKDFTDNLVASYKIMESTTASEYNALTDANKDAYRQIVSCGIIDLSSGTVIREKLWNMFDSESETRVALIALLGE